MAYMRKCKIGEEIACDCGKKLKIQVGSIVHLRLANVNLKIVELWEYIDKPNDIIGEDDPGFYFKGEILKDTLRDKKGDLTKDLTVRAIDRIVE